MLSGNGLDGTPCALFSTRYQLDTTVIVEKVMRVAKCRVITYIIKALLIALSKQNGEFADEQY